MMLSPLQRSPSTAHPPEARSDEYTDQSAPLNIDRSGAG
jgi:hypothetical protein